ncbi:UPAR/Ly6 domain-containing protein crok [Halyomorpha halys]|uniref:UPAR/Ly6 domain-containing protein crok n=1 Tax=Halyomorpha halys TaxID=286706 RepID=UPI0006D4D45B|nr:uncharacterized protein LOC106677908 [Halyomorpha halys]
MAGTAALLFATLLAIFVHNSEAIHCYVCSSDVDRSCGDPFNSTSRRFLISDCERDRSFTPYLKGNAVCRKFTHIVNDELVVVRSCAWGSESDVDGPCSPTALNYARKIESCTTCTSHECNSSPNLASLSMMIALPLALLASRFL